MRAKRGLKTYLGSSLLGGSLLGRGGLLGSSGLGGSGLLGGSSLLGGGGLFRGGGLGGGGSSLLGSSGLLGRGLLLGQLGAARGALGLGKDALFDAGLEGLVEERVEHVVRDVQGVVGLDVFLEGLTAGAIAVLELFWVVSICGGGSKRGWWESATGGASAANANSDERVGEE